MTLKDLLARAKTFGIKGRHDMPKVELEAAVAAAEMASPDVPEVDDVDPRAELEQRAATHGLTSTESLSDAQLETAVAQRDMVAEVSAAAEAAADAASDEVKPKRKGGGRGSNLNAPWQRKYYYLSVPDYQEAKADGRLAKSPMQIQLMLKYMLEAGVTSPAKSATGTSVSQQAVAKRYLVTKIEPHVLFAYYRKKMDSLGLTFAGYNLGGEGDEDAEAADEVEQEDAEADEAEADDEGEGDE